MLVTLLGKVTELIRWQPLNAESPMLVTGYPPRVEGIKTSPLVEVSHSVMVALPFDTEYVYIPLLAADTFTTPKANRMVHTAINEIKNFLILLVPLGCAWYYDFPLYYQSKIFATKKAEAVSPLLYIYFKIPY